MQTTETIEKLKDLQEVLIEKYDLERKIRELPKTLDGQTASLEKFKKEYTEKDSVYEAQKTKVTALKNELSEVISSRETSEKSMDAIETHREFEALEKQIEEAKNKEDNLRKELSREEKILDEQNEELNGLESLISSTEKDVSEMKNKVENEMDGYNKQIDSLSKDEAKLSEGIENELIFKFQRTIERSSNGVVAVKGQVCDGCHMILPAQFANEVHAGDKLLFCPYCGRVLYYEEVENEDENFNTDDAGSLVDFDDYSDEETDEETDGEERDVDSEDESDSSRNQEYEE